MHKWKPVKKVEYIQVPVRESWNTSNPWTGPSRIHFQKCFYKCKRTEASPQSIALFSLSLFCLVFISVPYCVILMVWWKLPNSFKMQSCAQDTTQTTLIQLCAKVGVPVKSLLCCILDAETLHWMIILCQPTNTEEPEMFSEAIKSNLWPHRSLNS